MVVERSFHVEVSEFDWIRVSAPYTSTREQINLHITVEEARRLINLLSYTVEFADKRNAGRS